MLFSITTPNCGKSCKSLSPSQLTSSHSPKISRRKAFLLSTQQKQRHTKATQTGLGRLGPQGTGRPEVTPCTRPSHHLTPECQTAHRRRAEHHGAFHGASKARQHRVKRPAGRKTEAVLKGRGERQKPTSEALQVGAGLLGTPL